MPENSTAASPAPIRNDGCASSAGGRSCGASRRACRRSQRRNAQISSGASASSARIQSGQPSVGPSISGTRIARSAEPASAMPPQSMPRLRVPGTAGTTFSAAATAMMPSGTLTRKIGRQSMPQRSSPISVPPSTGPVTEASPAASANRPNTPPRSCGGNSAGTSASVCGVIIAPPTPCSARAATSHSIDGASPQSAEAAVNSPTPSRNIRRRPKMSPARPDGSRNSAKTKM